jgi:O-antigen/teichoic acid export membrane protein
LLLAATCAVAGMFLVVWYADHYTLFHRTEGYVDEYYAATFVTAMGFGLLMRLVSDTSGALLQVRGYVWLDNILVACCELLWPIFAWALFDSSTSSRTAIAAAGAFGLTGLIAFLARLVAASVANRFVGWVPTPVRWRIIWALLSYGSIITLAQLADFLYAPTDFILINRLLTSLDATTYAPAVQIDAALLLLVSAIANVLLPKTAVAHARDDITQIRQYYVRGTLISAGVLLCAALAVWICSPIIFRLWLQNPMYGTRAILPLILIHTVVGGSSAVGRSILLGMGRVKPFTISVLIAGISNVILSYCFVRYLNLGLRGIVLGTIIAVVARCAIWMPWYVLRTLRSEASLRSS